MEFLYRFEFVVFAATLVSLIFAHDKKLPIAAGGLTIVVVYKLLHGFPLIAHLEHEWVLVANLFLLLTGFALLSNHFEQSGVPEKLPDWLPDNWVGGFVLLVLIFVLSAFLDNIAAALIGATAAGVVFKGRVHVGYLAAIVAASNAGGSPSVGGDTTTTMMWLAGVSPLWVLHAAVGAVGALLVIGYFASKQQDGYQRIMKDAPTGMRIDYARLGVVLWVLTVAVSTNVLVNVYAPTLGDKLPVIGMAVWTALLIATPVRSPHWAEFKPAASGAVFLLCLVLNASLMPVESLPPASWELALALGFVSALFDNIPLTAMCLKQGGYDWGVLAYCVGYGGSMLWFGSSAGVAVCAKYKEAQDARQWLRHGWHVPVGYLVGFALLMLIEGWQPHEPIRSSPTTEVHAP